MAVSRKEQQIPDNQKSDPVTQPQAIALVRPRNLTAEYATGFKVGSQELWVSLGYGPWRGVPIDQVKKRSRRERQSGFVSVSGWLGSSTRPNAPVRCVQGQTESEGLGGGRFWIEKRYSLPRSSEAGLPPTFGAAK